MLLLITGFTILVKAIQVIAVGEEATLNRIINLIDESSSQKSKIEKFIDCFAKWYTPFVIL